MNRKYIIPIKKHLSKFLMPSKGKIYRYDFDVFERALSWGYGGYMVKMKEAINLYAEKKLYKKLKPSQYPKEYLKKYPISKYDYLEFNLPVTNKKYFPDFEQEKDYWIKRINIAIENIFWHIAIDDIIFDEKNTIKLSTINFYNRYGITENDYKISSFITVLYRQFNKKLFYKI